MYNSRDIIYIRTINSMFREDDGHAQKVRCEYMFLEELRPLRGLACIDAVNQVKMSVNETYKE